MTSRSTVSVIIPTYNCGAYVGSAVESVLAQTYSPIELVVVDDGSTDNTADILRPYLGRITFITQMNRGVAAARNAGIAHSTGDLIAFLDADDLWHPEKLAQQVRLFEAEADIGVCFTNYAPFGEARPYVSGFDRGDRWFYRLPRRPVGHDAYVLECQSLVKEFILNGTYPCWTSTVVVRRPCLTAVGGFVESWTGYGFVEDIHLWIRLAKWYRFGYVDRVLAHRRVRLARFEPVQDEHDEQIFRRTVQMLATLHRHVPLSREEHRAVAQRIAYYQLAAGYFYFSRDCLAAARTSLMASLRASFTWKALYYLALSLIPLRGIRALRALKRASA
jgi:glycosyltransferase involved in cell wall biosynthesis